MGVRKTGKIKCLALLGLLLFLCGLEMNVKAEAKEKEASAAEIPIDEANFPDKAFRGYLSTYVDQDGNGMLSKAERDAVKWIGNKAVSYYTLIPKEYSIYKYTKKTSAELNAVGQIRSFAGIEHFQNLKEILLEETEVEELHLNNPKLQAVGIVADHLDFSMENAKKLKYFRMEAYGNISVAWDDIESLSYLSVAGDLRIPLDVVLQKKKLVFLNLNNVELGEGKQGRKKIDFSSLPLLEEVWLWNPEEENQEPPVEELHFENNPVIKGVYRAENGAAKRIVLPGKATCYEDNYAYGTNVAGQVEIKFQEEEALKGKKLPKGSVALTEENFPDVSFRVYLYRYADTDKDSILSKEERKAVTRIRNDDYNYEEDFLWNEANYDVMPDWEEEEMFTLSGKITSLKGIEYLPNLYEIQLKNIRLSPDVEEIVIPNPKLKYVDLSFYGNVKKIDFSGCKGLYLCHIIPNLESTGKPPVTVDFARASSLRHLQLGRNIDAFQAIRTLPKKEKLRLLKLWLTAPITEEDAALLSQLVSLKILALYFPEPMERAFWLETLDLSKMQNLQKVHFHFPFLKGLILPGKSVKVFYDYGSWKEPLKITYLGQESENVKAEAEEEAASATELPIDEANFPDRAFRGYLSTYVDQDGDGMLSEEERDAVKWIGNAYNRYRPIIPEEYSTLEYTKETGAELWAVQEVRSFAGIEHFKNLEEIHLEKTEVEELHLNNPKLQVVGIVADQLDFSMENTNDLKFFRMEAHGDFSVDWSNIENLSYLSAVGNLRIPLDMILQNKKLVFLNLNNVEFGEGKQGLEEIDFSSLPLLEEVWLWNPEEENQEPSVEGLHFGNNLALKGVYGAEHGAAKQLVLPGKAVRYEDEEDKKTDVARLVELKFQEEETLKGKKLPKGSVALIEENFPDVSFRLYLYRYADADKDGILSKEEREAVTHIQNNNYNYEEDSYSYIVSNYEKTVKFALAGKITSLKGIEYFPNLYEIQLKNIRLSPDVEEIVISNPKLKYVDLSFYGNVKKIDFSGCKGLNLCYISPNLESTEELPVTVDFARASSLTHLQLGQNIDAFQAIRTLPDKERLRLLKVWPTAPITEEDAALLSKLVNLEILALYVPEVTERAFWLEALDLSEMQNLKKVRFYFPFLKNLILPEKSAKVFYDYGSWKNSLKITYVK